MYTPRTQTSETQAQSVLQGMKLYTRHKNDCKYRKNRNHNGCGCPIWFQHQRRRWSARTNNWDEAMRQATAANSKVLKSGKNISLVEAVELYLVKRSKKARHADSAPYADRWLLRNGSKRQPSLLQWAAESAFNKLSDITSVDVENWRNTWIFREESFSMKTHGAKIKAFFTWAVKFDHLNSNPFDKLDRIPVTPVPTLPLEPAELTKLLSHANAWQLLDSLPSK